MHLTFSADIQAADEESRTLAGQIVPFGKPGNTSAGKVIFAEGSFVELDPKNVKLLLEHDGTKPIGKAVEFSITESGIDGKFKVSKTTRGTDTIIEAQDGLRTGFSVGASVLDYEVAKDGTMTVTAAELIEVSVVSRPAFGADAQITEVAATEPEEVVDESNEEETIVENENTEVVAEASAPVVEAAAPAPIYTRPRVKPLTDGEAFAHAVYAAAGNDDSKRILVEAADDTSNNTGFTLAKGLPQFISNTFDGRPAIEAIGGAASLPATGLSYTIPNLTQAAEVAVEGELDTIVQTDVESNYITIDVVKLAGNQIVSYELLDRSDPSFGEIMLRELRRAYAKASDEYVLAELLNGTWSGGFSGDWQGLQAFVADQVPVAYKNTGGLIADRLVTSTAWWSELIGAVDNSDRPVFNAVAPSNASGSVGISAPRGSVFGADLYVDHNISTVGLIDASAFLVARDAVGVWESPTVNLRTNILSDGSVQVSLYGYMAAKCLKPEGVRKFNLT
jgi:HK97 family phage prohead protease